MARLTKTFAGKSYKKCTGQFATKKEAQAEVARYRHYYGRKVLVRIAKDRGKYAVYIRMAK